MNAYYYSQHGLHWYYRERSSFTAEGWWKTWLSTRSPLTPLQHGRKGYLITAKWWWESRIPLWFSLTLWGMGSLLPIKVSSYWAFCDTTLVRVTVEAPHCIFWYRGGATVVYVVFSGIDWLLSKKSLTCWTAPFWIFLEGFSWGFFGLCPLPFLDY